MTVVRCLYCGAISPWWECNCKSAAEVREGKRQKPRVITRDGQIVLIVDAETAERGVNFGYNVNAKPRAETVNIADVNTTIPLADLLEDRKTYMRQYMKDRRAKDKKQK